MLRSHNFLHSIWDIIAAHSNDVEINDDCEILVICNMKTPSSTPRVNILWSERFFFFLSAIGSRVPLQIFCLTKYAQYVLEPNTIGMVKKPTALSQTLQEEKLLEYFRIYFTRNTADRFVVSVLLHYV